MKLNTFIVILCLFSTIYHGTNCSKTSRSQTEAQMLTNRFQYSLQNEMQNNLLSNLSNNAEVMSQV